jgi:AraC-like DNA-binding protein
VNYCGTAKLFLYLIFVLMIFDPQPIYPSHPLLKKHIAYYYFLQTDESFKKRYFAFPHTHTVLNIHCGASTAISATTTKVFGNGGSAKFALVQGIRSFPIMADLSGALNKVTIIFKPLGINHFVDRPLAKAITAPSEYFNEWNTLAAYQVFLNDFFVGGALTERSELLENFLLSRYHALADAESLDGALALLSDFEANLTVEAIADRLNMTARTLNRRMLSHLGISPIGFKKVARFRHSLQQHIFADRLKRMSDLAYQSNFYDLAYFNKIYRGMTGANPQQFFNMIDSFADHQLIFRILEDHSV